DAVEVIEVLVSKGYTVEVEQPLITLESDKATLEVPTTVAGTIVELKDKDDDSVKQGDVIAMLEASNDNGSDADAADEPAQTDSTQSQPEAAAPAQQEVSPAQVDQAAEQDIKVPDIGDFDAVEVIEVLVAAGDEVDAE